MQVTLGCKDKEDDVKYYKDVDLYTMKGVGEVAPMKFASPFNSYPYIEMVRSGKSLKLSYVYDDASVYTQNYNKLVDSLWVSIKRIEEGETYYLYEYIKNKEILELEYIGNPEERDFYLTSIAINSNFKRTVWYFEKGLIKKVPSANFKDYPFEKAKLIEISTVTIKDGVLKLIKKRSDKMEEEEICYKVGNLSYFWWATIGYRLEKIECD
ncbi:MAG: hypothetical protein ACO1OQ_10055 [Rufibacter sp.]